MLINKPTEIDLRLQPVSVQATKADWNLSKLKDDFYYTVLALKSWYWVMKNQFNFNGFVPRLILIFAGSLVNLTKLLFSCLCEPRVVRVPLEKEKPNSCTLASCPTHSHTKQCQYGNFSLILHIPNRSILAPSSATC